MKTLTIKQKSNSTIVIQSSLSSLTHPTQPQERPPTPESKSIVTPFDALVNNIGKDNFVHDAEPPQMTHFGNSVTPLFHPDLEPREPREYSKSKVEKETPKRGFCIIL